LLRSCLVLCIKGEFLEKRDEEDEELLVGPGEQLDQHARDPSPLHLLLYLVMINLSKRYPTVLSSIQI